MFRSDYYEATFCPGCEIGETFNLIIIGEKLR